MYNVSIKPPNMSANTFLTANPLYVIQIPCNEQATADYHNRIFFRYFKTVVTFRVVTDFLFLVIVDVFFLLSPNYKRPRCERCVVHDTLRNHSEYDYIIIIIIIIINDVLVG